MSGHSKWSQIKRKKGLKDRERGVRFAKLARFLTLAVIESGGITDPLKNAKLRLALAKAKEFNMPKETITSAIAKASKIEGQHLKEVVYEGFGPQGVAFVIVAFTDNPNRTFTEVRNMIERYGGKLAGAHSVVHLFDKCGRVVFAKTMVSQNQALDFAASIQAEDIEEDKDSFVIYIPFEQLGHVEAFPENLNQPSVDLYYRPLTTVSLANQDDARKILGLTEALENLEDVHQVYTNCGLPGDLRLKHEI